MGTCDQDISRQERGSPHVRYHYPGLFVTTIAIDVGDDGKAFFSESDPNGSQAYFLKEATMTSDPAVVPTGKREFTATVVSVEEATELATQGFGKGTSVPLFIVHGFNTQPSEVLGFDYILNYADNFKANAKYYPVPTMWAMEAKRTAYNSVQKVNATKTSQLLKTLVDSISNSTFPRKSLMCHSMGNHVVFNGACAHGSPDVQFENIFMVAADIPVDIFHDKPSEFYLFKKEMNRNKRVKAENFFGMLEKKADGLPKGKIYVLWNDNDTMLNISGCMMNPGDTRLGAKGPTWVDGWFRNYNDAKKIREKFRPYIEAIEVSDKEFTHDTGLEHSYQWEKWAIDIYENKCLN